MYENKNYNRVFLISGAAALFAQYAAEPSAGSYDGGAAVKFEFKYTKGDRYRILSTVDEDVYVNRALDHHAVIVNRVSAEATDLNADGSGVHDCTL